MIPALTVLVVDDYPVIRKIHIRNLRKMGILQIDEAGDGQEAITAAAGRIYDLIILDWHMPVMDGPETAKSLRSQGFINPILLCTDESNLNQLSTIQADGVSAVLQKPYSPSQFQSVIQQLLRFKIKT